MKKTVLLFFATGELNLERCVGDNTNGDDFHIWASGYKGSFYEVTFSENPVNFQWKFKDQITDCSYVKESYKCECKNAENSLEGIFDVTCSNTEFKTTIELKRNLTFDDTSKEVIVKITGTVDEQNTKILSVSGKILKCFGKCNKLTYHCFRYFVKVK